MCVPIFQFSTRYCSKSAWRCATMTTPSTVVCRCHLNSFSYFYFFGTELMNTGRRLFLRFYISRQLANIFLPIFFRFYSHTQSTFLSFGSLYNNHHHHRHLWLTPADGLILLSIFFYYRISSLLVLYSWKIEKIEILASIEMSHHAAAVVPFHLHTHARTHTRWLSFNLVFLFLSSRLWSG